MQKESLRVIVRFIVLAISFLCQCFNSSMASFHQKGTYYHSLIFCWLISKRTYLTDYPNYDIGGRIAPFITKTRFLNFFLNYVFCIFKFHLTIYNPKQVDHLKPKEPDLIFSSLILE